MRHGRTLIGPAITVMLATAVLALTPPAAAQEKPKETPTSDHWHGKYLQSPESLAVTQGVDLTMTAETLELVGKHNKTVLSIPLDQITQVDSHNERPANAALAGLKTAGQAQLALTEMAPADAGSSAILFGMFGFVPTVGIAAIVHTHDKYTVALAWGGDAEIHHEARIQLGPAEYASFITQIQLVTGKPWINLRGEEERLRHNPEDKLSARLDHPTFVGSTGLTKGTYQIVCLEGGGGQANLVFIAGNSVNPHKIRAIATAEIVGAADESPANDITYSDKDAATRITEVRIAGKRIRIKETY
ncbi:MAG TPA: hypothetical protein VEX69_06780 [Candidatus Limnocylindria bacterium]|nr:hypothetical protein [Candidatus Limnocylindria bacterium]